MCQLPSIPYQACCVPSVFRVRVRVYVVCAVCGILSLQVCLPCSELHESQRGRCKALTLPHFLLSLRLSPSPLLQWLLPQPVLNALQLNFSCSRSLLTTARYFAALSP